VALLACGPLSSATATPAGPATLVPIRLGADLTRLDLCALVPRATIEPIMHRKLASDPTPVIYYPIAGATGCEYVAPKDSGGNAYFGYVELAPAAAFDEQPQSGRIPDDSLGQSSYWINGPDARQFWVKIDDTTALLVAFGDQPNEYGATTLARLILAAIQ
jgi:hypothetical protein